MSVHTEAHKEFVKFFVSQYTKLLAQAQLQYLFRRLREEYVFSNKIDAADGSWWMLEHSSRFGVSALDSTIRHTDMCGFDLVIAISQTSINNQIRARFSNPIIRDALARWESEGIVVEVKSVTVSFLKNSKAIVTIHVMDAILENDAQLLDEQLELTMGWVSDFLRRFVQLM